MLVESNLYGQIIKVFPVPCIDLLILNVVDEVILVKRKTIQQMGFGSFLVVEFLKMRRV
jgi:hypothetical protein